MIVMTIEMTIDVVVVVVAVEVVFRFVQPSDLPPWSNKYPVVLNHLPYHSHRDEDKRRRKRGTRRGTIAR